MSAQQINQGATVTLTAPALELGTVTTLTALFDGPAISVTDDTIVTLPHVVAGVPAGWTITINSATAEEFASITVSVPIDAETTTIGGYSVSYYDGAGNFYSQWFDVIDADAEPDVITPQQVMQGQTTSITIPITALTYRATFISIDSPEEGTWLDNGSQVTLPYTASFTEAPAPSGWAFTLTALNFGVAYTASVTVPESYKFGTYPVVISTGNGHIYETEFEVIPAPPAPADTAATGCNCITGFDIISEVQVRMREALNTTAQQQNMIYGRHVRRVMDEVARRTWSIYRNAVDDLIENKFEYVAPVRPYELRTVCATDNSGQIYALAALTPDQANQRFCNWQNAGNNTTYQGSPRFYVEQGINTFVLLPVPNYSAQDGLIIGGYFGVDQWYSMGDCLPLPEGYDEAVVYGVCMRRCEEMAPHNATYKEMLPYYSKRYAEELDRLYMESARRTESRRGGLVPNKGKRLGAFGASGWGWYG